MKSLELAKKRLAFKELMAQNKLNKVKLAKIEGGSTVGVTEKTKNQIDKSIVPIFPKAEEVIDAVVD